jgi:hypothetical protein
MKKTVRHLVSSLLPFKGRIEVGMVFLSTRIDIHTIPIPTFPLKWKEWCAATCNSIG